MTSRLCLLGALLLAAGTASAQEWPNWRGPNYDGSTEASGLPTDFDKEKHVRWAADLPGAGELVALCLDRKSGKELWLYTAGSG